MSSEQNGGNACDWTEDEDGSWFAACGFAWTFLEISSPSENKMNFCPKCGKGLRETPYTEPLIEDEE